MPEHPDRIPFDEWINSQLSVARFYGGCTLNGVQYECDYKNCRTEIDANGEELFFPDLVKVKKEKTSQG